MRIVSLLPSATEIVYALGLGDDLVGVTYECDYPPEATSKPVVVKSALPQGRPLSSREIDEEVRDRMNRQEPIYVLEKELIQQLEPDVILTQDLCRVCAVPSGQVQEALEEIGVRDAKVLSLDPHTFDEVLEGIRAVGTTLGRAERAGEIVGALRARVEAVRAKAVRLPSIRVLCQEWLDPPFAAGHWVPEMVALAGGREVLGRTGGPSFPVTWDDVAAAGPEVVVVAPCGFGAERAAAESAGIRFPCRAVAVEADSYYSRPAPRLAYGVAQLAHILHPGAAPDPGLPAVALEAAWA